MPLCYVVVLICYVVFGFCSIFFTFSLYYSVVQKWRLSSVFGGFSLTPPLEGGIGGVGSRARDRQPGGALRRGAVERTPTMDEDAVGRRATTGAVARTPSAGARAGAAPATLDNIAPRRLDALVVGGR